MKSQNNAIKLLLAVLIMLSAYSCNKSKVTPTTTKQPYELNYQLAKTSHELVALVANSTNNIIRTKSQFENLITVYDTPLSKLTSDQLNQFESNIVFRENFGVVSLNYEAIYKNLSYDEFALVMSYFGMDIKQGFWGLSNDPTVNAKINGTYYKPTLKTNQYDDGGDDDGDGDEIDVDGDSFTDYSPYYCIRPHTCKKRLYSICTGNC